MGTSTRHKERTHLAVHLFCIAKFMMEDPMFLSSPQHHSCTESFSSSWSVASKQGELVEDSPIDVTEKSDNVVVDKCEELETIAYDDIGATSGAPIEFLQIQQEDDLSHVSSITPVSADGSSCSSIDNEQTRTRRDLRFVENATIFLAERLSAIMHDLADAIDPNVIEECKDRTRSMLCHSRATALDDMSAPRFTRIPSSIFTNETPKRGVVMTSPNFASEKKKKNVSSKILPKEFHQEQNQNPPSRRPLHSSHPSRKRSPEPLIDKNQDIEVTEEDGVIDCHQLGQEVEISFHQNQYVLFSKDMATELIQPSNDHISNMRSSHSQDSMKAATIDTDLHDVVIVHSWKMGSPTSRRKAWSEKKSRSLSARFFSQYAHETIKRGRSRGSGKTVSTVVSEESSSSLQTEGTRWRMHDTIMGQILDQ